MFTKTREISNSDDVIDSRDVIARIEQLEVLRQPGPVDTGNPDDEDRSQDDLFAELARLEAFMSEMEGRGGDEQWRGAWYPVTIIRDSYFVDYCQELCADIGDIPRDMPAYLVIDWEATARNIQQDYTSVEFDGVTYWVR